MEKKKCELCGGVARMFCESDQASLCFDCDGKVHGANFLVAKHTRCLLCSACQSHTPWKASGLRLCPTVSICEPCVARKHSSSVAGRVSLNQNLSQEIEGDDDGAESYDEDEESDEEAENQVVPLDATTTSEQQSPVVSSSSSVSSGGEDYSGDGALVAKRRRMGLDLNEPRPLKRLSRDEASSRSTAKINSVLRLHADRKSNGCATSSSSSS